MSNTNAPGPVVRPAGRWNTGTSTAILALTSIPEADFCLRPAPKGPRSNIREESFFSVTDAHPRGDGRD
jgi:hypothetical protein